MEQATHSRPLMNDEQLDAVKWLASNTEPDAYILATSYDAPWVLGWSERRVIAPGLFEWDEHNRTEWIEFLMSKDPLVAKNFLSERDAPVHIFYSENPGNGLELQKFISNDFIKRDDNYTDVYIFIGKTDEIY